MKTFSHPAFRGRFGVARRDITPPPGIHAKNWGAATHERQFALGPVSVTYAVAPVAVAETVDRVMPSGLVLRSPATGDQCWDAYPLCTPLIESGVSGRGNSIQDGFVP